MIFVGDIAQPYSGASSYCIPENIRSKVWFGNLEGGLILESAPRGIYNAFEAIDSLCNYLNISAFGVANNHILDGCDVQSSIQNLLRLNIQTVGGGNNLDEASRPLLVKDIDGTTYRILAFGWENIQCIPATENKPGVNPYTETNVMRCVNEALKYPEEVICFMHWNYELELYPQPYDRRLARMLIDMGVAAVIGCHAHRTQPIEFYKGKPIVYGLGNFLFRQRFFVNGKLNYPAFCDEEYAFEITNKRYYLHYFHYDHSNNRLDYVKSVEISSDVEFKGKAVFGNLSIDEYTRWFRQHRFQKKLLPIFRERESSFSYLIKSLWIRTRGKVIELLIKMKLR